MRDSTLFSGALLSQPSILKRLRDEFTEASCEFRADPKAFLASALKGQGVGGQRRKALLQFGLAIGITVYAVVFALALIFWSMRAEPLAVDQGDRKLDVYWPDFLPQPIIAPKAQEKAGGGGGGDETPAPPSDGGYPLFSLTQPVIAPRPEPQRYPPALPVIETVMVDPNLQMKRDELAPTGLPDGVPGPPSAGPGEDDGMGTGDKGGMGPGSGKGVNQGEGWNMGNGRPTLGGRTGAETSATLVDTRPVPLNRPRPNYTEEARKNKIQGTVRARVLVGADGRVQNVTILRGLPDGLNEEAVRAAMQMRFTPATKNGRAVPYV
ncbi:MAG TPA: energy transducer TonB, partial [Blastocatellia bacterium]|nr:energy transducer TonB [Blastocatellia bacterium]